MSWKKNPLLPERPPRQTSAMQRRRFVQLATALCTGVGPATRALAAGAASPAARARELRVGLSSKPGPFDFATAPAPEQTVVVLPAYQTLIRRLTPPGGADQFLPELARRWEMASDGRSWVFEIAEGRRFDDGAPVDAQAVRYSLERLARLGRGPASLYLEHVARLEVLDAMRLRVILKAPTPLLPTILADRAAAILNPAVAAKAVRGDEGTGWLATRSAGSGPYRLLPSSGTGTYLLERNPHWSGPAPAFDRLVYRVIADVTVREMSLRNGDIDVAFMMPPQALKRLQGVAGVRTISAPVLAFQNLAFNLARPVFADRRLREAIALAIDYDGIVRHLKGGHASAFSGPLPRGMPGADPQSFPRRYDPAAAVRLARAAGVVPGTRIGLIYPGVSPETDTLAQYLQAALAPLGLQVRIERLSVPAYLDRMDRGSYDAVLMGFVAQFNDPAAIANYWLDPAMAGVNNPARYDNPAVTALLHRSAAETDAETRAQQLAEVVRRANADLPYVYLFQVHLAVAFRDDLEGYVFDPIEALRLPLGSLHRRA